MLFRSGWVGLGAGSQVTCFKCKNKGHYANECPEEKAKVAAKPNPFKKGHVNHVNVEEVFGGLEVMNSKSKRIYLP